MRRIWSPSGPGWRGPGISMHKTSLAAPLRFLPGTVRRVYLRGRTCLILRGPRITLTEGHVCRSRRSGHRQKMAIVSCCKLQMRPLSHWDHTSKISWGRPPNPKEVRGLLPSLSYHPTAKYFLIMGHRFLFRNEGCVKLISL